MFKKSDTDIETLNLIVKSHPEIDLEKALDKTKLVQVERQVSGRNGTFTRMQWVKPDQVKSTDVVIGGKQNVQTKDASPKKTPTSITEENFPKGSKLFYRGQEATVVRVGKEFHGAMGIVVHFTKGGTGTIGKGDLKNVTLEAPKKITTSDKTIKLDDLESTLKNSGKDEVIIDKHNLDKDNWALVQTYASKAGYSVMGCDKNGYSNSSMSTTHTHYKFTKSKVSDGTKQIMNKQSFIDDMVKNYDTMTRGDLQAAVEAFCTANDFDEDKVLKKIDDLHSKQPAKADTTSTKKQKEPKKSQYSGKNMDELVANLKENGYDLDSADKRSPQDKVTLYDKSGKEYSATFNKYSDGGVEVVNIAPQVDHNTGVSKKKKPTMVDDVLNGKHSYDSPKSAIQGLLGKGYSKQDIMDAAEAAGITWDHKDHPAMNWMRASMAIQKHMGVDVSTGRKKADKSM